MTKTTYYEKSTDKVISEKEFFERLYDKHDTDVASVTECLECGKVIEPHETCGCEFED